MSMKADFNLVVGANQSLSYQEMKNDLNAIIKAINKKPYRIKIGFDMASVSNDINKLKSDLKELSNSAANIKFGSGSTRQPSGSSGGGSRKNGQSVSPNQYKSTTSAIKEYYSALLQLSKVENDVVKGEDGWYSSPSKKWDDLASSLNRAKEVYEMYTETQNMSRLSTEEYVAILKLEKQESEAYAVALEKLSNKEAAAAAKKQSKDAYSNASSAIKEYYSALLQLSKVENDITVIENENGKTYISQSGKWKELASVLTDVTKAYKLTTSEEARGLMTKEEDIRITNQLKRAEAEYKRQVEANINKKARSDFDAAKKKQEAEATRQAAQAKRDEAAAIKAANNERVKEAEYNISHYAALRKRAAATNKDIIPQNNGSGDFEWASKSGVYKELAHQMNEARVAYQNTIQEINAGKFSENDAANLTKRRADEAANLALQLEKQRAASRPAADSEKAQDAARLSSLRTYNRATKVLDDYRHVLKGHNESSKEAYRALEAQTKVLDEARNNYNGTADSAKKLHEAENAVKVETENVNRVFAQNNEHVNSLGGRIKGLATKFASWLGVSQVIMYAVRAIKQMISSAKEIDYAMTQLKIVTNATDAEMRQFANTAITLAKDLGKSVTELTKSIETFSRLGYSLKDASELAKYATIMSNVAGVSNEEATTGLTSIVKGFNLDVSDAEHVADVLVDVGQKYAVSAGEMMEAYEKSGAALSATNTSLEKSAGLIAAANASVQDASVIGTALKTVSARIRGSKSDLEELGENTEDLAEGFSKYADEIKALTGFDIMIDDTHFKDLYDIMEGISGVWDKLSDTQQARVAEILGGTRQLQVISSIIGNWKDAAGAYETAINSAGASSRANAVYMESITAHIDQMKASFEELSTNVMNSGFTKFIVDTGKIILEIINGITKGVGSLGTILIGGAIYKGFKSIA